MNVKLAENYVVGVAKASVADIASGKFVGTMTVGEVRALVALKCTFFSSDARHRGRAS